MNAGMKMLLVSNRSRGNNRGGNRGGSRSEMGYGRGEMNYGGGMGIGVDEMESRRRRDSRGRFRSEMENEMGGMENEMEMRRGGGRGGSGGRSEMESRRGYSRNEMEDRNEMRGGYGESETRSEMRGYPYRPFPVYQRENDMNRIGFNADDVRTDYGMNVSYNSGNEMEYRSGHKMGGGASSYSPMPLNREMADEWTRNMKNEDGTKGPHWTFEQAKQLMAQKGIDCGSPESFWAILCAMYSDYCAVLKKHGLNKTDVYVDLACAWLNDQDAVGGGGSQKAGAYYEHIVKK